MPFCIYLFEQTSSFGTSSFGTQNGVSTWVKAGSERMFSQDVRCLAILGTCRNEKFLISGGKITHQCVCFVRTELSEV